MLQMVQEPPEPFFETLLRAPSGRGLREL